MLDFRPVAFVSGILLSILSMAMIIPAVVDAAYGHMDWLVFAASSALTLFVGVSLVLTTRARRNDLSLRQTFIMTLSAWVVIALFGALPFAFSELNLSFTDAFFESMSGITTTGSTIIIGLNDAPPGILLWRAILQWLGGIGIIVMAIAVLPMLRVGGMQMFRVEAFDTDKVLPRAAQIAGAISSIYVALTFVAALALWGLGMNGFDAITHAMTSIATGGYSTYDESVGAFDSAAIDFTLAFVMILGSVPFVLYLQVVRGNVISLFKDSQVQVMLGIMALSILGLAAWLEFTERLPFFTAFRYASFNVISVMTGTGYSTTAYDLWGGLAMSLFFVLMFIGGCAGSTTCGIKIFRVQVLAATAIAQLKRLTQPHGIFIAYYNGKSIPEQVSLSVMSFFFLFIFCFGTLSALLGAFGLDFITAVSGAATALANVGPGLGEMIGPAGNFQDLPDGAKWVLCLGMIMGRLELFTVLVLFMPHFWRG